MTAPSDTGPPLWWQCEGDGALVCATSAPPLVWYRDDLTEWCVSDDIVAPVLSDAGFGVEGFFVCPAGSWFYCEHTSCP